MYLFEQGLQKIQRSITVSVRFKCTGTYYELPNLYHYNYRLDKKSCVGKNQLYQKHSGVQISRDRTKNYNSLMG